MTNLTTKHYNSTHHRVSEQTPLPADKLLLWSIIAIGLALRIIFQHDRYFAGDELGTLFWIKKDYHFILTNFNANWLTMPFYIAFLKVINGLGKGNQWLLVLPSLIAGSALIPIVYQLGLKVGTHKGTALIASFLVAVNPFLISYSVYIRSYSLMVTFAELALLLFICWTRHKSWRYGVLFAVCLFTSLIMHANAFYHAIFIGVLFILITKLKDRQNITIILPTVVVAGLTIAAYFPLIHQILLYKQTYSQPAPTPINYLPEMSRLYFATGFYALPALLLFGSGVWISLKKNNDYLFFLSIGIFLPIFLSSVAGVSVPKYAMARFLITILPLIILFIAEAIFSISQRSIHYRFWAMLLCTTVLLSWVPHMNHMLMKRNNHPWNKIISYLNKNLSKNDYILPLARKTEFSISFPSLPSHVDKKFLIKNIGNFLKGRSGINGKIRVFVISDLLINDHNIVCKAGKLRIFSYSGNSKQKIAHLVLGDLQMALKDQIRFRYVPYYKAIIKLLSALSMEKEIPKFLTLYYESQLIAFPGSNQHRQLRNYYIHNHHTISLKDIRSLPINF